MQIDCYSNRIQFKREEKVNEWANDRQPKRERTSVETGPAPDIKHLSATCIRPVTPPAQQPHLQLMRPIAKLPEKGLKLEKQEGRQAICVTRKAGQRHLPFLP